VKFKFRSRVFAILFVVAVLLATFIDILAYSVVIVPRRHEYDLLDHMVFFVWFAGKALTLLCVAFRKGPIKYCSYAFLLPLFACGVYSTVVFPFTSGQGFKAVTLHNSLLVIVSVGIGWLVHKQVEPTAGGN